MQITLLDSLFTLLPEKALFKDDEQLLIIADVHLGKVGHFRRAGIAIPAQAQMGDHTNLRALLDRVRPLRVLFLGDLFHSSYNNDWQQFAELIRSYPDVAFTLVRGNHDIIDEQLFRDLGIAVVDDQIDDGRFIYSHIPLAQPGSKVNIAGHIHPGVRLSGAGRQSISLPCFHFSGNVLLMPAFGVLTGLYTLDHNKADVYVVLKDEVRKL